MKVAYLFPGQGAQVVGMGRALYDAFPAAREVFRAADQALGCDLRALCFDGPAAVLTQTANAQPALLATSIAALRVVEQHGHQAWRPAAAAGLSVGEWTALVCAEAIGFEDAIRLVRLRGQLMEEAAAEHPGTMASIMGLPLEAVEGLCGQTGAEVANVNCPGQVVVSGTLAAVEAVSQAARGAGAQRVVALDVSGPFHSRWMERVGARLREALGRVTVRPPRLLVVSNVTAAYVRTPEAVREQLVQQVRSRVRWEESMRRLLNDGVRTFVELGAGTVLRGLLRRIDATVSSRGVSNPEEVKGVEVPP